MLGLEQLDLERHGHPVFGSALTNPRETFSAFDQATADQSLLAVEIEKPFRLRFRDPIPPPALDLLPQGAIGGEGLRGESGADGIGHPGLDRTEGPGVLTKLIV